MAENLLRKLKAQDVAKHTNSGIVDEVYFFGEVMEDGTIKLHLHTSTNVGFIHTSGVVLTHTFKDAEIAQKVLEKEMLARAFEAYQNEQQEIEMNRVKEIYAEMFGFSKQVAKV